MGWPRPATVRMRRQTASTKALSSGQGVWSASAPPRPTMNWKGPFLAMETVGVFHQPTSRPVSATASRTRASKSPKRS